MRHLMSTSSTETLVNSGYAEPRGGQVASSTRTRRGSRRAVRIGRRALVPLLLLLLWQVAAWAGWIHPNTLASPIQVWNAFRQTWADGQLWPSIFVSVRRVAIGLAIGVSVGTFLGIVAGTSRAGEEIVDGPMQMLRSLPFLGLMPLLIVWLGIGEGVKIGLVVVGVIYPIYLNLHKGIRAVDPRFAELARACGVGRLGVIRRIILPGALPSFLVGLRFSLGIAWLSLVVSETVNADKGIGWLIEQGAEYLRTDVIVMGLVLYALLGLLMEGIVRLLEWRLLPWRREFVSR
jgi:sulfonate transport system permease protein